MYHYFSFSLRMSDKCDNEGFFDLIMRRLMTGECWLGPSRGFLDVNKVKFCNHILNCLVDLRVNGEMYETGCK